MATLRKAGYCISVTGVTLGAIWALVSVGLALWHVSRGSFHGWVTFGLLVFFAIPGGMVSLFLGLIPSSLLSNQERLKKPFIRTSAASLIVHTLLGIICVMDKNGGC
jgi:hypothetical protein